MRFASSISSASDVDQAVDGLLEPIDADFTPGMADLVLLFTTAHFEDELSDVVERVSAAFPAAVLIGCTAEGTIGRNKELERIPSMSLLAGSMPDVTIRPFHVRQEQLESATTLSDWERIVGVSPESHPTFIAFGDPFRVSIPQFVDQINETFPGAPLLGGVASAARAPDENRLIVAGEIHREGIVGVALTGRLTVDAVVSQGCRPIGWAFVITKGERNVVRELGGRPALEQLYNVRVSLSEDDEHLARQRLLLGRVIDERKDTFSRGDFLIHDIIGVDQKSGAIGITGHARVGATVQFHVRDAASADEDLRETLAPFQLKDVRGAMLFGCNGRGTQMWPKPGHDAGVFSELFGGVPMAGFFCGGEFGPVGGNNYIHGFTASIALLGEPEDA
ncbi:MAG: FIST signal transduction protein [Planctomycetota bacterium]|jgi:small ligand-binding sensory domain FIST